MPWPDAEPMAVYGRRNGHREERTGRTSLRSGGMLCASLFSWLLRGCYGEYTRRKPLPPPCEGRASCLPGSSLVPGGPHGWPLHAGRSTSQKKAPRLSAEKPRCTLIAKNQNTTSSRAHQGERKPIPGIPMGGRTGTGRTTTCPGGATGRPTPGKQDHTKQDRGHYKTPGTPGRTGTHTGHSNGRADGNRPNDHMPGRGYRATDTGTTRSKI